MKLELLGLLKIKNAVEISDKVRRKGNLIKFKDEVTIGRHADCDIRIVPNPNFDEDIIHYLGHVSRNHCKIADGHIIDLGSMNGTHVETERGKMFHGVNTKEGDLLSIGETIWLAHSLIKSKLGFKVIEV